MQKGQWPYRPSPSSSRYLITWRFCPLPSIMEREKKNPPIVQQHCLAIAMRQALHQSLGKCWTAEIASNVESRPVASKLDVQLWAFALTTRSRSLSLGAECSFIYYWAQWHPAWCRGQVSTWDQSSSSLLHQAKGFLYLPNVGVLDLQLGRHDQCKDHLYHQRTPCFVFATKASKSAWAVEQSLLMCMWSMKSIALALLCELLLGGGFFPKPITRMNVNSVKCECQQWQQQQQNGLQLSCGNCDHFERRKRTYYQSSRCHILLSKQQQHFFHGFFNNKDNEQQHDFQFFHATISMNEPAFDLQSSRCFRIDKDKKNKMRTKPPCPPLKPAHDKVAKGVMLESAFGMLMLVHCLLT